MLHHAKACSAWYELRDSGLETTWRKPLLTPRSRSRSNFSGVTNSTTGKMAFGGLQILAHREDVDADGARVVHRLLDLGVRFRPDRASATFSCSGLCRSALACAQDRERLLVVRPPVAHARPADVRPSRGCARALRAARRARCRARPRSPAKSPVRHSTLASGDFLWIMAHGVGEDRRAAVGEIVAVDGGQHEVVPAQLGDRFGDALGFEPIDLAFAASRFLRCRSDSRACTCRPGS